MINSRRADTNDYWYRQDIRGSVTNIVDVDDDVVKSYTYDAYGNTESTGSFVNSFAYTGAVIDTETNLYYMNARYYDPATGRFISEDNYRGDGEAFWHLYVYCDGDPVNNADPTGHRARILSRDDILELKLSSLDGYSRTYYGAAKSYVSVKGSTNSNSTTNCYGYALGLKKPTVQPGYKSGSKLAANDLYGIQNAVIEDLYRLGRWGRKIDGPYSPILDDEYRIALRVGTKPYQYQGKKYYDYHFMVQTKTGAWAEKHGMGGNSKPNSTGKTPAVLPWDLSNIKGYYNSRIVYIAATYKQRN